MTEKEKLEALGYEVSFWKESDTTLQIRANIDEKSFYMAFNPAGLHVANYFHEKFTEYNTGKLKREKFGTGG